MGQIGKGKRAARAAMGIAWNVGVGVGRDCGAEVGEAVTVINVHALAKYC